MNASFTITRKDIEKLQETASTYTNEQEKTYKEILTDNNESLDLLCKVYDIWTWNEYEENNMEFFDDQRDGIIKELDFQKAFISTLSDSFKEEYKKDIQKFKEDLEFFTKTQKEFYKENYQFDNALLQDEFAKGEESMYKDAYKEYLYGSYREDGVLKLLSKHFESLAFVQKTGSITLTIEDEDGELQTKESFLTSCKYTIESKNRKQRQERAKKIQERNEAAKKREDYNAWKQKQEEEKIIEALS